MNYLGIFVQVLQAIWAKFGITLIPDHMFKILLQETPCECSIIGGKQVILLIIPDGSFPKNSKETDTLATTQALHSKPRKS